MDPNVYAVPDANPYTHPLSHTHLGANGGPITNFCGGDGDRLSDRVCNAIGYGILDGDLGSK